MNERTREYLKGRFGDYYRGLINTPDFVTHGDLDNGGVKFPRETDKREWGYIVFDGGMVRHKSIIDIGDLDKWLVSTSPLHMYYSSARYRHPGASHMSQKGWLGSDLIFDLDADHLDDVEEDDPYPLMLSKCKETLFDLLEFLEFDLGFTDLEIAFSGSRGYHVHVFDDEVLDLESDARREIVDYVRGIGFKPEYAFTSEVAGGSYGRGETEIQRLKQGSWSDRISEYIVEFRDDLMDMDEDKARSRLMEYEGIGEGKAEKLMEVFSTKRDKLSSGNLDVASGLRGFWSHLVNEAVQNQGAETDEPVTTDTRRLIRLQGSLHGGTGLRVVPIDIDYLDSFDPLIDAIGFSDTEQTIDIDAELEIEMGEGKFIIEEGENIVPEYMAIYLMLKHDAELR